MQWEILSANRSDPESRIFREEIGSGYLDAVASLWRHHLQAGVQDDGAATVTEVKLKFLPGGHHISLPVGPQWAVGAARLRAWAKSPEDFVFLAAVHERIRRGQDPALANEEILRLAAASPDFLATLRECAGEEDSPPDPPNSLVSPCGKRRVEWRLSDSMADSYSSMEVIAMRLVDRTTRRAAGIPYDFRDTTIRPVRFLSPGRVLLHSSGQNCYFSHCFETSKTQKLVTPEEAIDEYSPIVLTLEPQGRWVVLALFGTCALLAFAGAAGCVWERAYGLAVFSALLAGGFSILAAWLSTEHRIQTIDPLGRTISQKVRSCLHQNEVRFLPEDFDRLEVRRRIYKGSPYLQSVLVGKRELILLGDPPAESIAKRLSLPLKMIS